MKSVPISVALLLCLVAFEGRAAGTPGDSGEPAAKPAVGKLPHVELDARKKQVRIECEMLAVNAPLEFFCCVKGFNDYESMVRSEVKPSDLHVALLAIGLQPGQPLKYSESMKKWLPPQGPPIQISVEYEKNGKTVTDPAWKWMRDTHSKKAATPFTWVFTGSRVLPDGKYAADITGYLISIVNFELTVVDVPELASSSNELLEWERNPDVTPAAGAKVWMILEPVGNEHPSAVPQPARPAELRPARSDAGTDSAAGVGARVDAAEKNVQALRNQWDQNISRRSDALRQAAEAHYQIIQALRTQQQKLIDAADRIQRTIDQLEKEYQDLTTPRPPESR